MANVKEIEVVRLILDTYGVGVRAGVLTPCAEDEASFRSLLGLPAMPPSVKSDWADSEGIRRPITLQRPEATEGPDPLAVEAAAVEPIMADDSPEDEPADAEDDTEDDAADPENKGEI